MVLDWKSRLPALRLGQRSEFFRAIAPIKDFARVADNVIGDHGMSFRGGVEGAAVKRDIGRLQQIERRDPFPM